MAINCPEITEAAGSLFHVTKLPLIDDVEDSAPLVVTSTSLRVMETMVNRPVLPPDLVDSESDDENVEASPTSDPESVVSENMRTEFEPAKVKGVKNEEEDEDGENSQDSNADVSDRGEDDEKVGRWTLGKGAAKKPSTSKVRVVHEELVSEHTTSQPESDRLQIHSESQRLVREAEIHLPEHRPKQFKRFSEFRESLRAGPSLSAQVSCDTEISEPVTSPESINVQNVVDTVEGPSCSRVTDTGGSTSSELPDQPTQDSPTQSCPTTSSICPPSCSSDPSTFSFLTPEPISLNRKSKATQLLSLLPTALPPVNRLSEDDEGFVDLGESVLPVKPFVLTPADRLLARLKEHTRTPPVRKERGPIEYTVLTKVVDEVSGEAQLRVESVTHESSSQASESEVLLRSSNSHRRKFWQQHRQALEEQMRQRRLEQYEARLKEQGLTERQTSGVTARDQGLSDDDVEWSEGQEDEEEASTEESESSSSDSSSEAEAETEDEDDVPASSRRSKHACVFADDEAEESGNDETDANNSDSDDDANHKTSPSRQLKSIGDQQCTSARLFEHINGAPRPWNDSCSKFDKLMDLDDFTDLPSGLTDLGNNKSAVGKYCPDTTRRPQGSLGPGDVDLFMTEYSTVLDRTANAPSILASTRLDVTAFDDRAKSLAPHKAPETSGHSQWNDTPYELLYSQKPISQRSLLSKEHSTEISDALATTAAATPRLSSQDTVLLSQPSIEDTGVDSTLKLSALGSESTQASQEAHEKRRELFTGFDKSVDSGHAQLNGLEDTVRVDPSLMNNDSQVVHENRHNLFGSPVAEPPSSSVQSDRINITQDSQAVHANRFNLFGGSFQSTEDQPSSSSQTVMELTATNDSQHEHINRRLLFASSDQSITEPPNISIEKNNEVVITEELPESTLDEHLIDSNCPSQSLFSEASISQSDPDPSGSLVDQLNFTPSEPIPAAHLPVAHSQASQSDHERRRALFSELNSIDEGGQDEVPSQKEGNSLDSREDVIPDHTQSPNKHEPIEDYDLNAAVAGQDDSTPMNSEDIETKSKPRRRVVVIDEDEDENDGEHKYNPFSAQSKSDKKQAEYEIPFNEPFDPKSDETKASFFINDGPGDSDTKIKQNGVLEAEEEEDGDDDAVSSTPDEKSDNESFTDGDDEEDRVVDSGDSGTEEASDEEGAQVLALKQDKLTSDEQKKRKKRFRVDDFLDEEAELSGDENERAFYMDDEDEDGDFDEDLEELAAADDDPDLPSAGRLRRQVERVHNRLQADQDQRELRFLKELYLEDGDLYADDGKVRQRRFRWRGLENEDPLADGTSFADDGDATDNDSEEDDAAAAVSRFGPMDRWLQHSGALGTRQPDKVSSEAEGREADIAGVDLDSSVNADGASMVTSDEDEEEENSSNTGGRKEMEPVTHEEQTNTLSVLSLGRRAVLKARTLETQVVIKTVNKKVSTRKSTVASPKAVVTSKPTTTLTRFFSAQKTTSTDGLAPSSALTAPQTNTVDQIAPFIIPATLSADGRPKLNKCGSLLGRRFSASNLSRTGALTGGAITSASDVDPDAIMISDESESSSSCGPPGSNGGRKNQQTAHFLGLRNKVGLSCFNVMSQPETSSHTDSRSSLAASNPFVRSTGGRLSQNSSMRSFDLGKRPPSSPHPANLKRQRSASVFSALL